MTSLRLVDGPPAPARWSPAAVVETALAEVQAAKATWTVVARAQGNMLRAVDGGFDTLDAATLTTLRRILS